MRLSNNSVPIIGLNARAKEPIESKIRDRVLVHIAAQIEHVHRIPLSSTIIANEWQSFSYSFRIGENENERLFQLESAYCSGQWLRSSSRNSTRRTSWR